jgi:hypothetical protein
VRLKFDETGLLLELLPFCFEPIDAFLSFGMASERGNFHVGKFLFFFRLQFAENICEATRINVGRDKIIPTDSVSLEFIFLGEALSHQQLRAGPDRANQSALASHKNLKEQGGAHSRNNPAEHMFLGHMRNFVRDSARQLLGTADQFQQTGGDDDMSAGQRKCIGDWRVHDVKAELDLIRRE